MSEKMSTQIITCEISHPACSHGAHAFVENFYFWTFNTVKICIESLDRSIDVLSGYLIHETSHLCGARDHYNKPISDYFIKYNPKAIISPDKAGKLILNLDSAQIYDYWVLNGFCLPGFDCPNFN